MLFKIDKILDIYSKKHLNFESKNYQYSRRISTLFIKTAKFPISIMT